jgi:oligopeptide transport system permease protein
MMSRPQLAVLAGCLGLGVALLSWLLGPVETFGLVLGLGLIAGNAWLPQRIVRVTGSLLLGLLVLALSRASLGNPAALALGAGVAALAFAKAPIGGHRRVTFMVPSLVLLIFVTTLLMYHAPGSPFAEERATTAQVQAALRMQYGVPENAVDFFVVYMKRLLLDSSFGPSIKVSGRSVGDLLAPALPVSMSLGLLALVIAVAIGLALGVRAGLKPNSAADYICMTVALAGISLPNFVIGAALIIVFALQLNWFPVAGWGGYEHLLLPALTLALPYAAYVARLARNGTIEVMQQDFIRTARAKGLPEHVVVLKHALKGAILPVVSFLGPAAAGIMTGSFVVETLFGIPGMGQWFVRGAINRDYSVVLGTAIVYSGLVTTFNLAVDLAYAWLDPRARGQL